MVSAQMSDYYDGSRMFLWLSDYVGVSVDQVNFVISQFVALALASLFRTVLHPSKARSEIRHAFGLLIGLLIGYFCFGIQAIHLAGLPSLCYVVIRTSDPEIMQRLVLAVSLAYLSCIHLHRQIYDYGSYSLDITGPLMVVTQKVTSLAFCLHDGLCRKDVELTSNQRLYAVKRIPNPLEYFSFVLQFPSLMAGPALFYKDYMDFIEGTQLPAQSGSLNNNATVVLEPPSPLPVVCKKVAAALVFAAVFVKFLPVFHIRGIKDDDFVKNTTTVYKFWYLGVATMLVRFKYYFAWLFADAICNNSGLGFRGYDESGRAQWDKCTNINIYKFEFGTSLRESIEGWNIGTNAWLRMVVYDRVESHGTILTYALSALWHGFYPGYYLTFAAGALFTFAARTMRRTIRHYFTGNTELKFFYDAVTFSATRLSMAYITFSFVLLEFWPAIRLYLHMYLCLHVLAVTAIVLVPRIVPKARPGDSSHLVANGSTLADVLKRASPITNSVSKHHD